MISFTPPSIITGTRLVWGGCFHKDLLTIRRGETVLFLLNRNHLFAFLLLKKVLFETGESLMVMNTDGIRGIRLLNGLGFSKDRLKIINGKLPYSQYLCEMARHKIVFQLNQSTVPGQVARDAILYGVPCIGGNGTIESIAFPELSSKRIDMEGACEMAVKLCRYVALQEYFIEDSRKRAVESLSFEVTAKRIGRYLDMLSESPCKAACR